MKILAFLLGLSPVVCAKGPVFLENKGLLVMEAESTESRLGSWVRKTDVPGFQGDGHLEFTGNSITNGPPKSPLKYRFKIKKEGRYRLTLRARKRLETEREDLSNDCYVSVSGNFEGGGGAPLSTLKKDTKMFGGHATKWGWTNQLDSNHKKFEAIYHFKSGEVYDLTISGRSKNFNFDRILFIHQSLDFQKTRNGNPAESKTEDGEAAFPRRTTHTLVNKDGRKVEARLIRLSGDVLSAEIRGNLHRIKMETLSEKDQIFVRKWALEQE